MSKNVYGHYIENECSVAHIILFFYNFYVWREMLFLRQPAYVRITTNSMVLFMNSYVLNNVVFMIITVIYKQLIGVPS